MTVDLFADGALGGDVQTLSALRGGTVDATGLSAGLLVGIVKEFGLFDLFYLFRNDDEAAQVIDGPFGRRLSGLLMEKNLVALAYWGVDFRNLTNNRRPASRLEDVKGLKIRVLQSPVYVDLWNTLGANAVAMPFPELYTALEQGAVDGQENPFAAIRLSSKGCPTTGGPLQPGVHQQHRAGLDGIQRRAGLGRRQRFRAGRQRVGAGLRHARRRSRAVDGLRRARPAAPLLAWRGATVGNIEVAGFSFAVDVPDGIDAANPAGLNLFTLRATPVVAVPEPASLLLMAGRLAILALRRRRG